MTVDLPLCPEDVSEVLQEIVAREKFQNPEIVYSKGSTIGQGFLGVDTAVEITEGNRKLELFVKTAPKHEKYRKIMQVRPAYCNEFRFYSTIYPELDKFYQERTGKPLNIAAKYYGGSAEETKEIIVMENIKVKGFSVRNLKEAFNKEHVLIMMKTYAKLHGTSLAFKDQKNEVFKDIIRDTTNFLYNVMNDNPAMFSLQNRYDRTEEFLKNSENGRKILEKFKYFVDNTPEMMAKFKEIDTKYAAVVHGDCNGNNLMFRTRFDGNIELCLIDFQGTNWTSPMVDLSYSFYASCSSEENLSQLDYYLDEYYKVLSMTIKELGSDPDILYPKSLIKEHWKKCCGFSLAISIPVIASSLYDEYTNLVQFIDNPPTVEEESQYEDDRFDKEEFAKRMAVLFQHLIDNDFI